MNQLYVYIYPLPFEPLPHPLCIYLKFIYLMHSFIFGVVSKKFFSVARKD